MGIQGLEKYVTQRVMVADASIPKPLEGSLAQLVADFRANVSMPATEQPRLLLDLSSMLHRIAQHSITQPAHACLVSYEWLHTRLDFIQRTFLAAGIEPVWYTETSSPTAEKHETRRQRFEDRVTKKVIPMMTHLQGHGPPPATDDLLLPLSCEQQARATLKALGATLVWCIGEADYAMVRAFDADRDLAIVSQDSDFLVLGTRYAPIQNIVGLLEAPPTQRKPVVADKIHLRVFTPESVHALIGLPTPEQVRTVDEGLETNMLLALSTLVGNDFTKPIFKSYGDHLQEILSISAPPYGQVRIACVCAWVLQLDRPLLDLLWGIRENPALPPFYHEPLDQLIEAHETLIAFATTGPPDLGATLGRSYDDWCKLVLSHSLPSWTLALIYSHKSSVATVYELDYEHALCPYAKLMLPLLAASWRIVGHDEPVKVLQRAGQGSEEVVCEPRELAPTVPCLAGEQWPLQRERAERVELFKRIFHGPATGGNGPAALSDCDVTGDVLPTLAVAYYALASRVSVRPIHSMLAVALCASCLECLPAAALPPRGVQADPVAVTAMSAFYPIMQQLASIASTLKLCPALEPRRCQRGELVQSLLFALLHARLELKVETLVGFLLHVLGGLGVAAQGLEQALRSSLDLLLRLCPAPTFKLGSSAAMLWASVADSIPPTLQALVSSALVAEGTLAAAAAAATVTATTTTTTAAAAAAGAGAGAGAGAAAAAGGVDTLGSGLAALSLTAASITSAFAASADASSAASTEDETSG